MKSQPTMSGNWLSVNEVEMKYTLKDMVPVLEGEGHFIAPNATIIGSLTMKSNSSLWFNVVVRADADTIELGEGSNVQDGSVLHVDPGYPMVIGKDVTVGHKVMLHGCTIGDGSLIGINSVVLNGAKIGKGCLIAANAMVPENMEVPDGAMVVGTPAKIKRMLSEEEQAGLALSAKNYVLNAQRYNEQLEIQDE